MVLVPATAAKVGSVVLQAVKPEPLSYLYSSCDVPVPPLPGVVTLIVNVVPAHTDATFTLACLAITGPTGSATSVNAPQVRNGVVQRDSVDVVLDAIVVVPATAAKLGIAV